MREYSLGRGRKKAVKKFTGREGFRMILIVVVATTIMLTLWLVGVFRFN